MTRFGRGSGAAARLAMSRCATAAKAMPKREIIARLLVGKHWLGNDTVRERVCLWTPDGDGSRSGGMMPKTLRTFRSAPQSASLPAAGRRKFIKQIAFGSMGLLAARSSQAAEARIEVLLDEPIGTISPEIYGHFTEHIGGVIYDGIWVGENSKIPNQGGIRSALVEHMRRIKPAVVRWPGGCFADSYNWRDGIGPRQERPRRTNFWINDSFLQRAPAGPQKYDPNQFGTHEFVRFCELIGAQPYLAANVRSLTARDFDEWVEYCNAPAGATSLAQQRAA